MNTRSQRDRTLLSLINRLAEIKFSWFSSVRPDGRPHSVPICHILDKALIYIATPSSSVKVANIRSNNKVSLAAYLEDPEAGLIVDGLGRLAPEMRDTISPFFEKKYDWNLRSDHRHNALIEITPMRLIAWGQYGEGRWSGEEIQNMTRNLKD